MSIILLHNYREGNETDDMQHKAALSDINSSVVFTKFIFLQKYSYETNEFLSNHKNSGLSLQRDNKQNDP